MEAFRGMDTVDIGHGFYMVKFDMEADREKAISGGPWMIFDHYLTVRPWVPDFISSEVKISKTLVWIRIPCLGMEYYEESVLLALATAVGKPIKVDLRTLKGSRGRFARVCVEIPLDQPVVGRVFFRERWFNIEYEGVHLLCKKCGIFGHTARNCTTPFKGSSEAAGGQETAKEGGAPFSKTRKPIYLALMTKILSLMRIMVIGWW